MSDLVKQLTSYNLFNYLLPGTVFAVLAHHFTAYDFRQDDLFIAFFVYYFIGMVISRVGSVVVEPGLRRIGFVRFAPYEQFVHRSKTDPKLEVLSETNNAYRTLLGLFACLGILKLATIALEALDAGPGVGQLILGVSLTILFLFAYKKQTKYIRDRVEIDEA